MLSEDKGKYKVLAIAILNVLLPLISGGANLLTLIMLAVVSVFLYKGVNWVKYVFIILSVLHTLTSVGMLVNHEIGILWKLFYLIYGIYRVTAIVMLAADKNVKDYFISVKNRKQA